MHSHNLIIDQAHSYIPILVLLVTTTTMNSLYSTKQWLAATQEPPCKNNSLLHSKQSLVVKVDRSTFGMDKHAPSKTKSSTRYSATEIGILRQERDTAVIQNIKLERELEDAQAEIAARRQEYDTQQQEHEEHVAILLNESTGPEESLALLTNDDDDDDVWDQSITKWSRQRTALATIISFLFLEKESLLMSL